MSEPTDEMVQEIYSRIDFCNHGNDGIREGLAAVLASVERDLAETILADICEAAAELRIQAAPLTGMRMSSGAVLLNEATGLDKAAAIVERHLTPEPGQ